MSGLSAFELAADRLTIAPWPSEVVDAVQLVVADDATALPDEVLAAFLGGVFDPDLVDLGAALVELAAELRQVKPRCEGERS